MVTEAVETVELELFDLFLNGQSVTVGSQLEMVSVMVDSSETVTYEEFCATAIEATDKITTDENCIFGYLNISE